MDSLASLHQTLRGLRRAPGFTAAVLTCLGLAIGANTAVYTVAHAFLSRSPGFERPSELVRLYARHEGGLQWGSLSYADWHDLERHARAFSGVAAEAIVPFGVEVGGRAERTWGAVVSPDYFEVLGVRPALGRSLAGERDRGDRLGGRRQPAAEAGSGGGAGAVVLAHAFWRDRLGGDAGVLGRALVVNGSPLTVVGVAPRGFGGTQLGMDTALWVSTESRAVVPAYLGPEERTSRGYFAIARLAPGVGLARAETELGVVSASLAERHPDDYRGITFRALPEAEGGLHPLYRGAFRSFMALLLGVVALVLLVACANVAGLLLARGASRRREVAIRSALGASRFSLLRQQLLESALLAVGAGALGLGCAWLTTRLGSRLERVFEGLPLSVDLRLDGRVLLFSGVVAVLSAVVFSVLPAWQAAGLDPIGALRGGRQAVGRSASRGRRILVITQVAVSLLLLLSAALFVRSLDRARGIDPGLDADNVLVASLDPSLGGHDAASAKRLLRELRTEAERLPGVHEVGLGWVTPFSLMRSQHPLEPEGQTPGEGDSRPLFDTNVVDEGYFRTLGIGLLEGRLFLASDTESTPRVVIVNQAFATRYWPSGSAVGQRLRSPDEVFEIVGVVETGKYYSLGEDPLPFVFYPFEQRPMPSMNIYLKTRSDPLVVLPALRHLVERLDPDLPVYGVDTLEAHLGIALLPVRAGASVLGLFGVCALSLAAVGLYGILAYSISLRRRELGVRRAVGADGRDVVRLVLGQGLRTTAWGILFGGLAAVGVGRLLAGFLYGLSPLDPISVASVIVTLLVVTGLACWIPCLAALRVDPSEALRSE